MAKKPLLRVIEGHKDRVENMERRLGEQAELVGRQWRCGQIGVSGERKLLGAFARRMPGHGETMLKICAPAMLEEIGTAVAAGGAADELIAFLAYVFEPAGKKKLTAAQFAAQMLDDDVEALRRELELIPSGGAWELVRDSEGHYIDIEASPNMPTAVVRGIGDAVDIEREKVSICTIYLENPATELEMTAKFILLAPARLRMMLRRQDELLTTIARYQAADPKY